MFFMLDSFHVLLASLKKMEYVNVTHHLNYLALLIVILMIKQYYVLPTVGYLPQVKTIIMFLYIVHFTTAKPTQIT